MAAPTVFPTWMTAADGRQIFVSDLAGYTASLAAGATWMSTSPVAATQQLGAGAVSAIVQVSVSNEQPDTRPLSAQGHGSSQNKR